MILLEPGKLNSLWSRFDAALLDTMPAYGPASTAASERSERPKRNQASGEGSAAGVRHQHAGGACCQPLTGWVPEIFDDTDLSEIAGKPGYLVVTDVGLSGQDRRRRERHRDGGGHRRGRPRVRPDSLRVMTAEWRTTSPRHMPGASS